MKRLLPNVVVRSMRRKGLNPGRVVFVTVGGNKLRCCGLTGLLMRRKEVEQFSQVGGCGVEVLNRAERKGLDKNYVAGFIMGWDGRYGPEDTTGKHQAVGYRDGARAWKLSRKYF